MVGEVQTITGALRDIELVTIVCVVCTFSFFDYRLGADAGARVQSELTCVSI